MSSQKKFTDRISNVQNNHNIKIGGLSVTPEILEIVQKQLGKERSNTLFANFATLVAKNHSQTKRLLEKRVEFQKKIDSYLKAVKASGKKLNPTNYEAFLTKIGYIEPECDDFQVSTQNVDGEFKRVSTQLVCPAVDKDGARFAINAANARWGNLYDAYYGKKGDNNVIDERKKGLEFTEGYNTTRGAAVIQKANEFLDKVIKLKNGAKFSDVAKFSLNIKGEFQATQKDGSITQLKNPEQFVGFQNNEKAQLSSLLFKNKGLHIELNIDPSKNNEKSSASGINAINMESATTTIIDLEDSVALVDAEDKARGYRNIQGLLRGDIVAEFQKNGKIKTRSLNSDKKFKDSDGNDFLLPGRGVMLFRSTGLSMETDAVTYGGKKIPESYLDILMIALAGLQDIENTKNSREGSIYIVMPKMHSSEEVRHAVQLFSQIETIVGMKPHTLKMGIMDEEQRMSLNLKNAIYAAKDRAVFINTGFLDRTGSLYYTNRKLGVLAPRDAMQAAEWRKTYEANNVMVGIMTGLLGKGQIGKGMWAKNKDMKSLTEDKNRKAMYENGATVAWVPGPVGATLDATNIHLCNNEEKIVPIKIDKSKILDIPVIDKDKVPERKEVEKRLRDCAQSILGYVVHWVNEGIGCSSIPNIDNVFLMEDRATLRINSQFLANWLSQGYINANDINQAFAEMAREVDLQNNKRTNYTEMSKNYLCPAFQTALRLVFNGDKEQDGYVENALNDGRKFAKALIKKSASNDNQNKSNAKERPLDLNGLDYKYLSENPAYHEQEFKKLIDEYCSDKTMIRSNF